jgi:hypothetical protein
LDRLSLLNAGDFFDLEGPGLPAVASHRKLSVSCPTTRYACVTPYVIESVGRDPETGEPIELQVHLLSRSRAGVTPEAWIASRCVSFTGRGIDRHSVHCQYDRLFLPKSQERRWRLSEGSQSIHSRYWKGAGGTQWQNDTGHSGGIKQNEDSAGKTQIPSSLAISFERSGYFCFLDKASTR